MALEAGYIPISRKLFDHPLWKEKRTFSKFEAWLDLLKTARYEDSLKTEYINNKPIKWGRGQLIGSIRFLMERWRWGSITKVETFLKNLQNEDMISVEKGQGISIITICKYDTYNLCRNEERTEENFKKDSKRTAKGQQKDKTNKDNKVNKGIITIVDSKEPTIYKRLVEYWLKVVHPDWDFSAGKGKALNAIIGKLKARLEKQDKIPTDDLVFNAFKFICENLPEFFQDKDLLFLESHFNELLSQIKNANNGTKQPTPKQTVYDSAAAFRPK